MYETNTGTSVATATVSGVAAILKSTYPDKSNTELIELMKTTADFIYNDNRAYINQLGRGRVNMYQALTETTTPEFVDIPFNVYPNPASLNIHETFVSMFTWKPIRK